MGNKHHTLTKKEIDAYQLDQKIQNQIDLYLEENPYGEDLHILDWGCGRGRAMLSLLKQGLSA